MSNMKSPLPEKDHCGERRSHRRQHTQQERAKSPRAEARRPKEAPEALLGQDGRRRPGPRALPQSHGCRERCQLPGRRLPTDAQGQAGGLWPSVAELLNKHLLSSLERCFKYRTSRNRVQDGPCYPPGFQHGAAREVPGSAPGRSGPEPAAPGLVGCREAQKGAHCSVHCGPGQKRPQPEPPAAVPLLQGLVQHQLQAVSTPK